MPFARSTLTALRNQAIEDITTSGVPGLNGLLRNAVLPVLAWVMAGFTYSLYGFLDWIALQGVPFTATDEYLYAWGALVGIYPKDSTPASGLAQFTGTPPGVVVLNGSTLTRQDGTPYTSTADAAVDSGGVVLVPFIAAVNGAATDCAAGTPISLNMPPAGVNAGGVTVGPTQGGTDQETQDEFRTRMLLRYASPPQGGAATDYIEWATAVPGCTRAWINPQGYGAGTVVVYVMFDDANTSTGGFPIGTDGAATDEPRATTATGDQLSVADYIWTVQPVTVLVWVAAPIRFPIDIDIADLDPNTADMQAAIVASINDVFLARADVGGTIYPSDIYAAIQATPGVVHFAVDNPTVPVAAPPGGLPVAGAVTFPPLP
jgi:uncharacterized phage protein gp47/JayE